jgi:hypothetical protein
MTDSDKTIPPHERFADIKPFDSDDVEPLGAAKPNSIDEPVTIHIGPDDDPPLGPLTLKEAYGEALGAALEWNADAQLAAAASSAGDADAFVDDLGTCSAWSFSFLAPGDQRLDLDVVRGQALPSAEPPAASGAPFALDDLADSPELIARARAQGLDGEQFIVRLGRDAAGALAAQVQSLSSLQQVNIDPTL